MNIFKVLKKENECEQSISEIVKNSVFDENSKREKLKDANQMTESLMQMSESGMLNLTSDEVLQISKDAVDMYFRSDETSGMNTGISDMIKAYISQDSNINNAKIGFLNGVYIISITYLGNLKRINFKLGRDSNETELNIETVLNKINYFKLTVRSEHYERDTGRILDTPTIEAINNWPKKLL